MVIIVCSNCNSACSNLQRVQGSQCTVPLIVSPARIAGTKPYSLDYAPLDVSHSFLLIRSQHLLHLVFPYHSLLHLCQLPLVLLPSLKETPSNTEGEKFGEGERFGQGLGQGSGEGRGLGKVRESFRGEGARGRRLRGQGGDG